MWTECPAAATWQLPSGSLAWHASRSFGRRTKCVSCSHLPRLRCSQGNHGLMAQRSISRCQSAGAQSTSSVVNARPVGMRRRSTKANVSKRGWSTSAPMSAVCPVNVSKEGADHSGKGKVEEEDLAQCRQLALPTLHDIRNGAARQGIDLQLRTIGPFFRVTATINRARPVEEMLPPVQTDDSEDGESIVIGSAQGWVMPWVGGKILHLDAIRLQRQALESGTWARTAGLFIGVFAGRHGYDQGCVRAELLAINDSEHYHKKLVEYYRRRGFKKVLEVTGETISDVPHLLMWGGVGTRMDADLVEILSKWAKAFR